MDEGTKNTDFEGYAWIYAGIKRDTKFIVGFAVGKRTQNTCDTFLKRVINGMEQPTPSHPIQLNSIVMGMISIQKGWRKYMILHAIITDN